MYRSALVLAALLAMPLHGGAAGPYPSPYGGPHPAAGQWRPAAYPPVNVPNRRGYGQVHPSPQRPRAYYPAPYGPRQRPHPAYAPARMPQVRRYNRGSRVQPRPDTTAAPEPAARPVEPDAAAEAQTAREALRKEALQPDAPADLAEGKQAFLETLVPIVREENARIREQRRRLKGILETFEREGSVSRDDRDWLRALAGRYRVSADPLEKDAARQELLKKVDVIPIELALAQAANESAWGSSRFAVEGHNLFGIWTYDASKGIKPRERAEDAKHLVRKYASHTESVRHYLNLLNSHPAYAPLRAIRAAARRSGERPSGHALAAGLTRYSAKGEKYIESLQDLIARYALARFSRG